MTPEKSFEYMDLYSKLKEILRDHEPKMSVTDFWRDNIYKKCRISYANFSNVMRGRWESERPDIIGIIQKFIKDNG